MRRGELRGFVLSESGLRGVVSDILYVRRYYALRPCKKEHSRMTAYMNGGKGEILTCLFSFRESCGSNWALVNVQKQLVTVIKVESEGLIWGIRELREKSLR